MVWERVGSQPPLTEATSCGSGLGSGALGSLGGFGGFGALEFGASAEASLELESRTFTGAALCTPPTRPLSTARPAGGCGLRVPVEIASERKREKEADCSRQWSGCFLNSTWVVCCGAQAEVGLEGLGFGASG